MVQDFVELMQDCEFVPNAAAVSSLMLPDHAAPVSIWGVAPVGPIHLGYDGLIVQQKNLMARGCQHRVLLADFHAMMTHGLSLAEVSQRSGYYEHYLKIYCGLQAEFIRGSDFQMRPDYTEQFFDLVSRTPITAVKDAVPASVRKSLSTEAARVSAYLYPIMQCLDAWYLGANLIIAEQSQKKIYSLLNRFTSMRFGRVQGFSQVASLSHLNGHSREVGGFVYLPTAHDIRGQPLAESSAATRISIHEDQHSLATKVRKMFAPPSDQSPPPGRVNALLEHFRYSVFPWRDTPVDVRGEDGQRHQFDNYDDFVAAYETGQLHPNACKEALIVALWERLQMVQGSWGRSVVGWVDPVKAIGLDQPGGRKNV